VYVPVSAKTSMVSDLGAALSRHAEPRGEVRKGIVQEGAGEREEVDHHRRITSTTNLRRPQSPHQQPLPRRSIGIVLFEAFVRVNEVLSGHRSVARLRGRWGASVYAAIGRRLVVVSGWGRRREQTRLLRVQ
jgi:hypothetical protein